MTDENLADRDGAEVLGYVDRAFLALAEATMLAEQEALTRITLGETILKYSTGNDEEIIQMDTDVQAALVAMGGFYNG